MNFSLAQKLHKSQVALISLQLYHIEKQTHVYLLEVLISKWVGRGKQHFLHPSFGLIILSAFGSTHGGALCFHPNLFLLP